MDSVEFLAFSFALNKMYLPPAGADDGGSCGSSDSEGEQQPSSSAKRQQDYLEVKHLMKDEGFVQDTIATLGFVKPIMQALRVADRSSSQHPVVWETMARLDEHYSKLVDEYEGPIPIEEVSTAHQAVVDRWEYLHDMTHSAAHASNPHFHSVDTAAEQSVMSDLQEVFKAFYPDLEDQVKVGMEFSQYKTKSTEQWKKPLIWLQAKLMSPWEFWNMNGGHSPLLRPVALVVLKLNHAAGGCERNWSTHDFLLGKRRASTSASVLSKETYFYTNQRMLDQRQARGKAAKKRRVHHANDGNEVEYPLWADKD